MSHKRKGQLVTSPEWCKHLRKYMRKHFWRRERLAEKKFIQRLVEENRNKQRW